MTPAAMVHSGPMPPPPEQMPESAFRLMVEGVLDYAIFMLDQTGHVISWNRGAERIKGYRPEDILGRHFSTFYPPEDIAARKPQRELETAVADGRLEDEGWRVRKDGTRFWANVVITALFDNTGELRGFGKVTRDMTERRRDQEALRASEERFRLLVHGVRDYGIFMLDQTGHVISWNAGAERVKGYRAEEILGRHFSTFYPPEDIATGKPERELEVAVAEGSLEDEGWRLRKDGTRFWANVVITALFAETGELRGFGKVTRDMTERRRADQELLERRRLVSHLVEAQELERRRIAWDVHDDSVQAMVAVGMRLQLLAGRLPEEHAPAVIRLDHAVRESVERLRMLVFRLRPPEIDHGLVPALQGYLNDVAAAWGLTHEIHDHLTQEPPADTAVTAFRICQEALANVGKHAHASRVEISLSTVDNGTSVEISDDGVGVTLSPEHQAGLEHFGIIEMRDRAETAGGWWTLGRRPTGGTTVHFWLPTITARPESHP
jgi:PAS domain S-box-containing protein